MTDLPRASVDKSPPTCKAEVKRQIEIAERVLWETRDWNGYHSIRDRTWLQDEHARLIRELHELKGEAKP